MQRLTALVLTVLGVTAGVLWWQLPAQAQGVGSYSRPGTYYSQFTTDAGLELQSLTSWHPDGTAMTMDTSDFGLGGVTAGLDTPAVGTWTRVAPGEFRTKYVFFSYDPTGVHTYTVVVTLDTIWPGGSSVPGGPADFSYVADLYLAAQNPATDPPAAPGVGSGAGQTWLMPY